HGSDLSRPGNTACQQPVLTVRLRRSTESPHRSPGFVRELPRATERAVHDPMARIPQALGRDRDNPAPDLAPSDQRFLGLSPTGTLESTCKQLQRFWSR